MSGQVVIDSLVKEYGNLRALNQISFSIQQGDWVALMALRFVDKVSLTATTPEYERPKLVTSIV